MTFTMCLYDDCGSLKSRIELERGVLAATFVTQALFEIAGKLLLCTDKSNFMSILDELPNHDKSTDSQQAESATVAGIYIRDSKGKNMMPSIWYLIPIISPLH